MRLEIDGACPDVDEALLYRVADACERVEGLSGRYQALQVALKEAAAEMRDDQYRKLDVRLEAAQEALASGEKTFADIMEECKAGSSQTVNYFHESSTRFNEDYYQRAAAFEEVGEVSTAYAMTNGYALLYYAGNLPACERVPLEEVRDLITEVLAQESRSEQLAQARAAIVEAAVIEVVQP